MVECGGVGYDLSVSNTTLAKLGKTGEQVTVYTYLHVQEDALRLFGFYGKEEKSMFEKLISISGVGPKLALQILSGIDLTTLAISIAGGDVKALARIKGIGKKTAERIILELREKIDAQTALEGGLTGKTGEALLAPDEASTEAVMALASLGFNKTDAIKAVASVRDQSGKVETLIMLALRSLDK